MPARFHDKVVYTLMLTILLFISKEVVVGTIRYSFNTPLLEQDVADVVDRRRRRRSNNN